MEFFHLQRSTTWVVTRFGIVEVEAALIREWVSNLGSLEQTFFAEKIDLAAKKIDLTAATIDYAGGKINFAPGQIDGELGTLHREGRSLRWRGDKIGSWPSIWVYGCFDFGSAAYCLGSACRLWNRTHLRSGVANPGTGEYLCHAASADNDEHCRNDPGFGQCDRHCCRILAQYSLVIPSSGGFEPDAGVFLGRAQEFNKDVAICPFLACREGMDSNQ